MMLHYWQVFPDVSRKHSGLIHKGDIAQQETFFGNIHQSRGDRYVIPEYWEPTTHDVVSPD
jgi:hypothetical protein